MKKIIVEGKTKLRKGACQCPYCGCQFHYTNDEVYKVEGFNETFTFKCIKICVKCPWCLEEIRLDTINDQFSLIRMAAKRALDKYDPDYHETTDDYVDGCNDRLIRLKQCDNNDEDK